MHTYNSKEEAVATAIDSCIADGILADILTEERDRVMLAMIGAVEEYREVLEIDRKVALILSEEAKKTCGGDRESFRRDQEDSDRDHQDEFLSARAGAL